MSNNAGPGSGIPPLGSDPQVTAHDDPSAAAGALTTTMAMVIASSTNTPRIFIIRPPLSPCAPLRRPSTVSWVTVLHRVTATEM